MNANPLDALRLVEAMSLEVSRSARVPAQRMRHRIVSITALAGLLTVVCEVIAAVDDLPAELFASEAMSYNRRRVRRRSHRT